MRLIILLLSFSAALSASTITFVGPGTGATDGSVYVGPYDLTVDGLPIKATCFTYDLHVGPPYEWPADVVTMGAFSGNELTKLEEAAWLVEQFAASTDWAGIHHGIWDIFGAGFTDPDSLGWMTAAEVHYGTVDPSQWDVVVPVNSEEAQHFLERVVPEPGNGEAVFIGILVGLGVYGIGKVMMHYHFRRTRMERIKRIIQGDDQRTKDQERLEFAMAHLFIQDQVYGTGCHRIYDTREGTGSVDFENGRIREENERLSMAAARHEVWCNRLKAERNDTYGTCNCHVPAQPRECAARKALNELVEFLRLSDMGGSDDGWQDQLSDLLTEAAIAAPCPCGSLRAENAQLKQDLLDADQQVLSARARDLAHEASNRDLEAKRETQRALEDCRESLRQSEADLLAPADWRAKIPAQLAEWQQMSADLATEKSAREKAEAALVEAVGLIREFRATYSDSGYPDTRARIWRGPLCERATAFVAAHRK